MPPGTGTGSPSRLTSTGPSTEISSTARVYGGVSALSAPLGMVAGMQAEQLLRRLFVGDAAAVAAIAEAARAGDDPLILVAAVLFAPDADGLLARAEGVAITTRDRQVVAIAAAHLRGERELVDALARDHLADHPDNLLVAWMAGHPVKEGT